MNPANVSPWGCPWHGLVQGGQVALPNGSLKTYPQPVSTSFTSGSGGSTINRPQDTYGITHRHAAGMPPATSSAADIAAGREWRNEAILSGGRYQVHGKPLDGWVYIDPDGARWLVRYTVINEQTARSLAAPLAVTLTFSRFGVVGGQSEVYVYSVSLPLPGLGASGSAFLMFDAFKPDGSAAIINVHTRSFTDRRVDRRPVGFLELSIVGPGSAAAITPLVVRDRSQTQVIDPQPQAVASWWDGESYQPTNPLGTYSTVYSLEGEFTRISKWILALWYDEAGGIQEVLLRTQATSTYSAPRPEIPRDAYTTSASGSGHMDLLIGETVVDSMPFSVSVVATLSPGSGVGAGVFTLNATVDGVTLAGAVTVEPTSFGSYPFPDLGLLIVFFGTTPVNADAGAVYSLVMNPSGAVYFTASVTSATWFTSTVTPYWYSRQVVGFEIRTENGAPDPATRRWRFRPPVTPSGLAGGAAIDTTTPTGPTFYGSHDPYSGSAVWGQSAPVCYV